MKIAFIFPPYRHKLFAENLRVVDEDFGVFPPINVAYAAAIAESAGHETMIVDANALKLTIEQTIERLMAFKPDAIGYYFSTYMFFDTLDWARRIKASVPVPVLAGGINMSLYPAESMGYEAIDYGISGEGIKSIPRLLAAIEKKKDPLDIPGVWWKDKDGLKHTPPETKLARFDEYPFPARHLLPNDRYYSITSKKRNFTIMMTSLGCIHRCSFCAMAKTPYRARSVELVLDEMEQCTVRFGVREIDIFDPDFCSDNGRVRAICRGMIDRGLGLEWSCRARVDGADWDMLDLMSKAGCRKIYFGIETPNEESLRILKKDISVSKVNYAISGCKNAGISPLGFFMVGMPGETQADIIKTIRYALSLGLDYAQFSRLIAKPMTELDLRVIRETGKDYWRDYIKGIEPERRIKSPWSRLTEGEIEAWTKLAYVLFYYRPYFALKTVAGVKSLDEMLRGAKTAIRMLFSGEKL